MAGETRPSDLMASADLGSDRIIKRILDTKLQAIEEAFGGEVDGLTFIGPLTDFADRFIKIASEESGMDKPDAERIAAKNPQVDLELLRKAQEEMRTIVVKPAQYDLEPPFSRRHRWVRPTAASSRGSGLF